MKKFSRSWISSKNQGKQRKYRINAPLHIKQKFASCHLSKELKKKHGKRSTILRNGDKVKILRGQFKGKEGKVEKVMLKESKAIIAGVEAAKKEGTKLPYPVHISNLMITEIIIDDKKRKKSIKSE
jgi:large subunit ribosomal protein L24